MLSFPCAIRWWHFSGLLILLAMLTLPGSSGYAAQEASLYSFIPLESPVTFAVDVPMVWQSTADFRKTPTVDNELQAIEKGLGLSFEKDILPWAGQAACTLTDFRQDGPGWALLLHIRDPERMIAPARLATLIQKVLPSGEQTKWLALEYKGVGIWRTQLTQGTSVLKVATATVDGWLVIAVGDGVIKKIIDARNGSSQSLEKHPLFTRAMGGLPTGAIGQVCVNGQGILAQIQKKQPRR